MEPVNWHCPYCGHAQTATEATYNVSNAIIYNDLSRHGPIGGRITSVVCSNKDCKEMTLEFSLHSTAATGRGRHLTGPALKNWRLWPESKAKPQPDYIPEPIVKNYEQACRIRDLSANASATMARRCLQGMIRDFCGISKRTLAQEIEELRARVHEGKGPRGVSHDTMVAIDHIRSLGNIGAHMERDIDLIVDVEPNEAQALIDLIELLLEEWYVAKRVREAKLERLGAIVDEKERKKEEAQRHRAEGHE